MTTTNRTALTEKSEAIKTITVQGVAIEVLAYDRKSGTSLARTKVCGFWMYDVGYITKRCQVYSSFASFDLALENYESAVRA
jgi:hypothetical protein